MGEEGVLEVGRGIFCGFSSNDFTEEYVLKMDLVMDCVSLRVYYKVNCEILSIQIADFFQVISLNKMSHYEKLFTEWM